MSPLSAWEYWSQIARDRLISAVRIETALQAQLRRAREAGTDATRLEREVAAAFKATSEAHAAWVETVRGK